MIREGMVVACVASAIGTAACGGDFADEQGAEAGWNVVDSAGVRLVTNLAPAWTEGEAWRLAGAPRLDIGALDGPAATQFFQISDGAVLSDGGFVVSGFGSHDVRRFDARGTHVWTAGREGDGPGEFRGLTTIAAGPGDTLLTYDFRHRRISRWASDGSFIDDRALEGVDEGGFPFVDTFLPDGRVVYTFRFFGVEDLPAQGEVRRDPVEIRVAVPGDSAAVLIGEFPGPEWLIMRQDETEQGARIVSGAPPFARTTTTTADADGVWVGDSDRPEVLRYGLDGTLESIVRLPLPHVPVTADMVARALADQLEDAEDSDDEDLARQRWEELPLPGSLPYFEELTVDRTGNLWIRSFQAPGDTTRTWYVVGSDGGRWLGTVTIPDRVSPLDIGTDYVLSRFGDELDVEHVQLWELIKP